MTKIVKKLPVSAAQLAEFKEHKLKGWIRNAAKGLEQQFSELCTEVKTKLDKGEWVYMKNKDVYYIHKIAGLMPNLDTFSCRGQYQCNSFDTSRLDRMDFAGFKGVLPTETEAKACFNKSLKMFRDGNYIRICGAHWNGLTFMRKNQYCFLNVFRDYTTGTYPDSRWSDAIWHIPVHRFNGINSDCLPAAQALLFWLNAGLEPDAEFFSGKPIREAFKTLSYIYSKHKEFLKVRGNTISLDEQKVYAAVTAGKTLDFLPDTAKLLAAKSIAGDAGFIGELRRQLLESDYRRAMIDRYDEQLLLDPNRGHWDLWDMGETAEGAEAPAGEVILGEGFTARNPADDINHGIVGIDFGTKSTVVVYENDQLQTLPLQAGSGCYAQGVQLKNYENPTVVQFIDIESFLSAYQARAGRPATSWEEVTVSHTAFENLTHSNSDRYYSFFEGLKHWCGTAGERVKLRDAQGHVRDLPPFMDLVEGDLNPVEIYAYYLGIYINNMVKEKHIFLQYILSFPVTYERGIREKMRRSFEAGIRKSLPTALLSNETAMKQFRVQEGASEPAAYAITALEEYGFDPCDEKEDYYGVFDFGGGTTDFDFGVYREASEDRYDYTLLHFGANGDRTLGGENLLRLLAFEVFKANKDKLLNPDGEKPGEQQSKIPFAWAADKHDFPGSEGLIRESQEAQANMHTLMEALRPVWEAPDSEESKKILDSGLITVNLFREDGKPLTSIGLHLSNMSGKETDEPKDTSQGIDLQEILRRRIDAGIYNFFIALREAFDKSCSDEQYKIKALSDVPEISIFLAGNSSKAALVKELFQEYTTAKGKAREILGFGADQSMPVFKVYPALGTEEAYQLQEDFALSPNRDNLEKPTGKTGVAFGLLRCRESGNVKVVDITPDGAKVPFQYYVGRNKKRRFKTVIDRNTKLNQWYAFIDAGASFDLLYTDVPSAATNQAPVTIARQIHVVVDSPDPEAVIYVRAVEPRAIEYIMAKSEDELKKKNGNTAMEPIRIDLG